MLGSLILYNRSADTDVLPIFEEYETGSHTPGRSNGTWFTQNQSLKVSKVYHPQRDKDLTVYHNLQDVDDIVKSIDSLPGARFLDKLQYVQNVLPKEAEIVINSTGDHGTWSLISTQLIYTVVRSNTSTQLVWSKQDIIPKLRKVSPIGYTFYRLPPMPACFLNTQALCSRYWRWMNAKEVDTLKIMNALEVFLDGKVR